MILGKVFKIIEIDQTDETEEMPVEVSLSSADLTHYMINQNISLYKIKFTGLLGFWGFGEIGRAHV